MSGIEDTLANQAMINSPQWIDPWRSQPEVDYETLHISDLDTKWIQLNKRKMRAFYDGNLDGFDLNALIQAKFVEKLFDEDEKTTK